MGRRRQRQDRRPADARTSPSSRGIRADTTPGHTVYANGRKFVLRLLPSGILHDGDHLRHRQRRGRRSAGAVRRDRRARGGRRRDRRPAGRQRQGAPDPAVSPRARPAERGAPRRAQDRHDVARHRAGLRGQDRAPRRSGRRPRQHRTRWPAPSSTTSPRATASSATRRWTRTQVLADLRKAWTRMAPWVTDVSLLLSRARAERRADHVRGRAGHAARHRSRHLPVRHLVERDDRRRLHRARRAAAGDRRRARRGQGLHDARRRRAAADRADRRDRQPAARERAGVRRRHRPPAPLRLVRRGRGALRRPRQRPRRAGADQARRARRARGAADLHGLPLQRRRR